MVFYSVLEAIQKADCFLCRLLRDHVHSSFEHLLYESVNDPGFRETWRASRGYCQRHARLLADFSDGLGISILYKDLIDHWGMDALLKPAGQPCAACAEERLHLLADLNVLVRYWDDADMQKAVHDSGGLCGPHLRAAREVIKDRAIRRTLTCISERGLQCLKEQLQDLINGYDYLHERPMDPQVRVAWRRAIEKLVGQLDLIESRGGQNENKG